MEDNLPQIAIFASGNGSNAENIVHFFRKRNTARVNLIISNNSHALVLERAKRLGINSLLINRSDFKDAKTLISQLKQNHIDLIVLAGFLWLIPGGLIEAFPQKIVNIHPALLPKYGGKGMYGDHVHKAVSAAKESESGISVHFVNQAYDEGSVIFQQSVAIEPGENPDSIAEKVHQLEYAYFPSTIEKVVLELKKN